MKILNLKKWPILLSQFKNIHICRTKKNRTFGLELSNFITECFFGGLPCEYENDFVWFYDFVYGNCFRFNSGKNSTSHSTKKKEIQRLGQDGGLYIKAFTGNNESSYQLLKTGLHIIIHNSSIFISSFEGFEVSTGVHSNIAINRQFIYKKEYPYCDCMSDIENNYNSNLVEAILKTGQIDCFNICFQEFLINIIGCYQPLFDKLNATKPCLAFKEILQIEQTLFEFISIGSNAKCNSKCPLECDYIEYKSNHYFSNFPNLYFVENYKNFDVAKMPEYKNNNVSLGIYYDSYSFTKIQEEAQLELMDQLSSIGRVTRLFMRISVLSFDEIFEIIFLFAAHLFSKKISNSNYD